LLELGLSARRIFQDLGEEGFEGSYYSVRRFVRRLGARQELPFRRIEKAPGEEAQVDFGTGAWVRQASGKKRRPYVFRIVLSHSRKAYSEVVYRQTTENFLRCIENAFWSFGGCPQSLVIDNLRAAVKKVDWFEPELNPKVEEFCRHYGVSILPTRPFTPRHKGKVEKGIDYVQANALKGRIFECLEEQNDHLQHWERTVADTRIHGTTRQQVARAFAAEKPSLQALPVERFPFFHEGQRSVNRDGHAEVDKSYYSVPPEYVGRRVWARWDSRLVRILNQKLEVITTHAKVGPGKFSTHPEHLHSRKISTVERGGQWLLMKASEIGPHAEEWAVALFNHRGIQALRTLQGLLSLTEKHESQGIDAACRIAHSYGSYRLASIRRLMDTTPSLQHEFEFTNEHPIIRDITVYGELVRNSIKSQAKRLEHSPPRSPRKDYHE
jgi:transposase